MRSGAPAATSGPRARRPPGGGRVRRLRARRRGDVGAGSTAADRGRDHAPAATGAAQPAAPGPGPRPARRVAGDGLRARRPGAGQGGPGGAAGFLDTTLVALDRRNDAVVRDVERVLRQRNALLRQCGGRLNPRDGADPRRVGRQAGGRGRGAGRRPRPAGRAPGTRGGAAYAQLAGVGRERAGGCPPVGLTYVAPWREAGLAEALLAGRDGELRRAVTLVGPHRDELGVALDGLPARTHASQGEQRSLALALKLAAHRLVTDAAGEAPLLLLDDVFSELDPSRCRGAARAPAGRPDGADLGRPAARRQPSPSAIYRVAAGSSRAGRGEPMSDRERGRPASDWAWPRSGPGRRRAERDACANACRRRAGPPRSRRCAALFARWERAGRARHRRPRPAARLSRTDQLVVARRRPRLGRQLRWLAADRRGPDRGRGGPRLARLAVRVRPR